MADIKNLAGSTAATFPQQTGGTLLAAAGPVGGYLTATGGLFGAGKTAHQQPGYQAGTNPDQTINSILQRIQKQGGVGTFNEGQLNQGIKEFQDLQSQMQSGKLSQGDFVNIASAFVPQLSQYAQQMAGSGSAGGKATSDLSLKLNDFKNQLSIYQTGRQLLGRDLTQGEFLQALPAFGGPNGQLNGNAFLANLAQQYKANPSLDPGSQQNTQKPGDVQGSVQQQFQSVLGRAPTQDELSHFSQAIQSNQTDAYGLGNFLKQMPEYTNKQDTQFRSGLNTELQNYDVQEFNREKSGIVSDYAQRGMAPGSSPSLDYALTDLMGKIAENRSAYLAQLSAGQYGGNKDLAIGNYQNSLNQMYNTNQQNRSQTQGYGNQLLNQGFAGADYQSQMRDYMNFMNANRGKTANPLYGAIGGGVGAIGGAFLGGPAGATAGYNIGSGLGNAYGYLNS